jgi:hypothetical protein
MQKNSFMLINRLFSFLCLLLALSACTPTFDWRTVRSDDLMYEALYPGKPSRAEKTMLFQQQKLTMTMEAVKVKDSLYAVGVIQVPPELRSSASMSQLLEFIQSGILSNLKTSQPTPHNAIIINTSGQTSEKLPAKEWVIDGMGPDGQRRLMRTRLVQRVFPDGQVLIYQQTILQTLTSNQDLEKTLSSDEHSMFLSGFKPY